MLETVNVEQRLRYGRQDSSHGGWRPRALEQPVKCPCRSPAGEERPDIV